MVRQRSKNYEIKVEEKPTGEISAAAGTELTELLLLWFKRK